MARDAPQMTLYGRTSAWREHRQHPSGDQLLVTWLHHRCYGTLGVAARASTPLHGVTLSRRAWVCLTGVVEPCVAYALPDDPRSAATDTTTPLLLSATSVQQVAALPPQIDAPCLSRSQSARIAPGRLLQTGQLAPVIGWADALVWRTAHQPQTIFAQWNTVYGVITRVGQQRYLRYVLRHQVTVE